MCNCINEARKMIEEMELFPQNKGYFCKNILQELIERCEKLPQDNVWIPVSERLPEEGYYLCCRVGDCDYEVWENYYAPIGGFCVNSRHGKETHWMNLPPKP